MPKRISRVDGGTHPGIARSARAFLAPYQLVAVVLDIRAGETLESPLEDLSPTRDTEPRVDRRNALARLSVAVRANDETWTNKNRAHK